MPAAVELEYRSGDDAVEAWPHRVRSKPGRTAAGPDDAMLTQ